MLIAKYDPFHTKSLTKYYYRLFLEELFIPPTRNFFYKIKIILF